MSVKQERAYRADELFDALIIDSEGYIYGKVGKININEDEILLFAYEDKPDVKKVPDIAALKEELLKEAKTTFGSKLRRKVPSDILAESVRKEFGLGLDVQLSDDHYLKYAERLGVSIPYTKAIMERKEPKGTVSLNEVKTMRITVIGKEKMTRTIKVILLRKPKEADFRKIPVQDKVAYRTTEALKDKPLLDADGNVLGYVDSVVLFKGMPGVRVYVSETGGQVSLPLLIRYLEENDQPEEADMIRKNLLDMERLRSMVEMAELEEFMRRKKLSFMVPAKFITTHGSREFVADIPWNMIHKIGDIILLNVTLTDLRSKGYV